MAFLASMAHAYCRNSSSDKPAGAFSDSCKILPQTTRQESGQFATLSVPRQHRQGMRNGQIALTGLYIVCFPYPWVGFRPIFFCTPWLSGFTDWQQTERLKREQSTPQRNTETTHFRHHQPSRRRQDHPDRKAAAVRRRHSDGRGGQIAQNSGPRHQRLDGD